MTLTCALVDDEPLALDLLESYVRKTPGLNLCGRYASAIEAMAGLAAQPVDLLFLDIQMPDLSGLDFSRMVDSQAMRIVFTTAFSQYAIDGYKVGALDYLLKPVSYPDFLAAVQRARTWAASRLPVSGPAIPAGEGESEGIPEATPDYLFVKSDYKVVRINYADIVYIEGLKDYVKIYLTEGRKSVISLTSMKALTETLPADRFLRIHRSYIVSIDQVTAFSKGRVHIGEKELPISDGYKEAVQRYIDAHLLQGR